jgi:CBS domain-containing protein
VDEPVLEAIQIMADRHVGTRAAQRRSGGRDLIRLRAQQILMGRSSAETLVWQIMTAPVIMLRRTTPSRSACRSTNGASATAVLEGVRMVGMISIGDLVRAVIDSMETISS